MRTSGRQWSDLTGTQRLAVITLGGAEVVLTAISLADLVRRPAAEVRGPKAFWALAVFVQPVGPIAYLLRGRRTR
jgi:Phospholipase_D-nuclease N-terminal